MAIDIGANLGSDVTGMRVVIDPSAAQKGADVVNRSFDSMPDHANQAFSKIDQTMGRLRRSFLGLQTAFTGIGIGYLAGEILRADVTMTKILGTLRTATGSAAMAAVTFREVRETSRALSIDLGTAANAFARLMAATKGTNTEGQATMDLFKGVSAAVTATGGGAYELYLALKAVEQMASKGRIQMEELRGQLGDVLPGAFNRVAEAIGVTTGQLNRMMKAGLSADDVLPKLGPHLLKVFKEPAEAMGNSIIGVLNKWKTFKLELLSTVGMGGFAQALSKTILRLETLLEDPRFVRAAKNFGDLLGTIINKITDAIMYLGNHINYVKAAFLAFGSIKVIEFFRELAFAINTVRDSLIALKIAEAGSGLLKPGGGAGPVGGAASVGVKGGLASLAVMYPYLFDSKGNRLTPQTLSSRMSSPSFVSPEVNPMTSLGMLTMMTGKKGRSLTQSEFSARLASSEFYKALGFSEREQMAQMAKQLGLSIPFTSQLAGLINHPVVVKTSSAISSLEGGFAKFKKAASSGISGIQSKIAEKYFPVPSIFQATDLENNPITPSLYQSFALSDLARRLRPETKAGVTAHGVLPWRIDKSSLEDIGENAEVPYITAGSKRRTMLHEFGHNIDYDFISGGYMTGGKPVDNKIIDALAEKSRKEYIKQANQVSNEVWEKISNEDILLGRKPLPKKLRNKIISAYGITGGDSKDYMLADNASLGTLEYYPEVFAESIINPRRTRKIAPMSFNLMRAFQKTSGPNVFDPKTLELFNILADKNGKLLSQSAINARLAGKAFSELGLGTRLAVKNLADFVGVNVSWGKVAGGIVPTVKSFVKSKLEPFKKVSPELQSAFSVLQGQKALDVLTMPSIATFTRPRPGTIAGIDWALGRDKNFVPKTRSFFDEMKGLFYNITGKKGSRTGQLLADTYLYHATSIDNMESIIKNGLGYPGDPTFYSSKDFAKLFGKIEHNGGRGYQGIMGTQATGYAVLRALFPKGSKLAEGHSQPAVEFVSRDVVPIERLRTASRGNTNFNFLEDWTFKGFKQSQLGPLRPKSGGVPITEELLRNLPVANTLLDKNGKLLSQSALNAKLAGKAFGEFTVGQRLAVKNLAELNGLAVSWGRVAGGLVPTTKAFVDTLTSRQTWANAFNAVSSFTQNTAQSVATLGKSLGKSLVETVSSKQTWSNALAAVSNFTKNTGSSVLTFTKNTAQSVSTLGSTLTKSINFANIAAAGSSAFDLLKKGGTKAFEGIKVASGFGWGAIRSGANLAVRGITTVGSKLLGVASSLVGIAAANPFLAIAAAAAGTYIVYDMYKDKLITIGGHTARLKDYTAEWWDLAKAAFKDLSTEADNLITKLNNIRIPGMGGKNEPGTANNVIFGGSGFLISNPVTAGYRATMAMTAESAEQRYTLEQAGKGQITSLPATPDNMRKYFYQKGFRIENGRIILPEPTGTAAPLVNPITGEPWGTRPQLPEFWDKYPREPRILKKDVIPSPMDEIQKAVAGMKERIKGLDQIFEVMTAGPDILQKGSLSYQVMEAENKARTSLTEYNKTASEAPATGGGARKARYSPEKGLGKEYIDLTKMEAYKTGLINAADQLGQLNAALEEQNQIQQAVNAAMLQGEYAVDRARASKEHSIQIQKILNGLDEESARKLQPYIDNLKKLKSTQIELSVVEKIRADVARANLSLPWNQLAMTMSMLKEQQKEGLSAVAYWLESTRAAEQYKQQLDEILMSTKKFSAGAHVAFRQYAEYAQNSAQQAYEFFSNSIRNMEDAFVQLFSFKGFGGFKTAFQQMLSDYQRTMVRKYITGPVSDYFAKKFGVDLGLVKADGSKSAPFYVRDVDRMIGGASGVFGVDKNGQSVGGWIGMIAKILGLGGGKKKNALNIVQGSNPDLPLGINGGVTPTWDPDPLNPNKVKNAVETIVEGNQDVIDANKSGWAKLLDMIGGGFKGIFTSLGGWIQKLLKIFSGGGIGGLGGGQFPGAMGGGWGGFLTGIPGISTLFSGGGGSATMLDTGGLLDIGGVIPMFANGGVMTSSGELKLNRYRNGGIAYSPQLALYGEGRRPEAYVPLPDGRTIPVMFHGQQTTGNNRPVNINISHDLLTSVDVEYVSADEVRVIAQHEAKRAVASHAPSAVARELYNPNSSVSKAVTRSKETRERR